MPIWRAIDASSSALAERGAYGSVAITESNRGKRIRVTAPTSLSRMIPNTSRRGRGTFSSMYGATACAACVLCNPSIQMDLSANAMRSRRPRHRVFATPRSIDSRVMRVSRGCSSRAARTASATLRRWNCPGRGVSCSSSTRMKRLPNFAARRRRTSTAIGSEFVVSTSAPRWITPAFSAATLRRVLPRYSVWSRPMGVMSAAIGRTMFVTSSRPPIPTSSTARSAARRERR